MKKTILTIVLAALWSVLNGFAQEIPVAAKPVNIISGKIRNEKGEGLQGASIIVKDSKIAGKSDTNGHFRLSGVPPHAILLISFIGYLPQEIPIANKGSEITITLLPDSRQLEEVIVSTGYQEIPLERATGSFASISKELFNRQISTDVISRLKGITPSLLFDERSGSSKLSIRGRSTIFANDQPLIVLDNFPYEGDINNINPNDIENISILRDAAAASIWGARAGNGVIVINTKKGSLSQPLTTEFHSNLTRIQQPDQFYQPRMTSSDFIDTEILLFQRGFYNADLNNTTTRPPISEVVDLLDRNKKGLISNSEMESRINVLRAYDLRNDLTDLMYRKGTNIQNALSLRGGAEDHTYYYSAGFDNNLSNAIANDYSRLTLNTSQSFRPVKGLQLNASLNFSQTNSNINNTVQELVTGGPSGRVMYPYTRLIDENGDPLSITKDYRNSYKDEAFGQGYLDWQFRPLEELELPGQRVQSNDIRFLSGLRYQLGKLFSTDIKYQYQRQWENGNSLNSIDSYYTRNLINRYTSKSANDIIRNIPVGGILDLLRSNLDSHNGRAQLNYNHNFKQHSINALAGIEIREIETAANSNRVFGYDPNLGSTVAVNPTTSFPLSPNGNGLILANPSISETLNRFRSYFTNVAYTLNNKYIFSASGRIDQSNHFGVSSNQRAVPLWSAGIKWDLASEEFYKLDFLPTLRLKATYGYNGNIDKTVTAYTTANFTRNSQNGLPAANINNPPNPNLRWEKTGILNLGIEFGSKNGRLNGNLEYYSKKGIDLIGQSPLDPTSGQSSFRGNVANMKGSGVDLELHSINLDRKLRWESNLLFSYSRDEVTSYAISPTFASYMADASLTGSQSSFSPTPGKPLFGIYSKQWAGLDPATGNPMGYVHGVPSMNYSLLNSSSGQTVDSLVFHGRALPPVYGALRNSFSMKGFTISANITYRFGYYFKRRSIEYSTLFTTGRSHSDYALRWQKAGDEAFTSVPAFPADNNSARDNFYRNAEILVEKGDNIRLQDINLSYDLTNKQWTKMPFRKLSMFIYLNNAGLLWTANKQGIDPDYPDMKLSRSIAFGLRTTL